MRVAALHATIVADRRPARALRMQMEALGFDGTAEADAAAVALFEGIFYRLPPFADDQLPDIAAEAYARTGEAGCAALLAGLAAQMRPGARPPPADTAAAVIAAAPQPAARLLAALERLERTADWAGSAVLFEAVWPCVEPLAEFWIYFRMSGVYAELRRHAEAALFAALSIQIEPTALVSREPYRRLFERFRDTGRAADAAAVALRQRALHPDDAVAKPAELAALLEAAGPLPPSSPPAGRNDRIVFAAEIRAPRPWPTYGAGVPAGLVQLLRPMPRPAVSVATLRDAELLVCGDAVAVLAADGMPQPDLSVGEFPALLRRRLDAMRLAGEKVAAAEIAEAVLLNDEFPSPNLCHFLLDHATRLVLYRRADMDLGALTVIGPAPRTPYQHATLARLGVGKWHDTAAPARLRVGRLHVSSNCRHLRHPAHWGAAWAIAGVRALFDLAPRAPARRLLVSRADGAFRRIHNEAEIAAMLAPHGFETIIPGQLDFAAQIAAFRDASHIVAPHGAGLGNILFAQPGTRVLEVFHPLYGTWAYAMASDPLGLAYASLVARDALSDAAEFNDPALPQTWRNQHAGRGMLVEPALLREWMRDAGVC